MKYRWNVLLCAVFLFLLLFPTANAQSEQFSVDIISPMAGIISPIIGLFSEAGKISTDPAQAEGLVRFILWILMFALVFYGCTFVFKEKNNISAVVAFCFATISAIFMPSIFILQIGATWGQLAFLVLMAPLLFGLFAFIRSNWGTQPLLAALGLLTLIYVLSFINLIFIKSSNSMINNNDTFRPFAGVIGGVLSVVIAIAFFAMIYQFMQLFGGGAPGGGGLGGLGGLFGNRGNNDRAINPGGDDVVVPPPDPRIQQYQQDLANVAQLMDTTQEELRQLTNQMANPNNALQAANIRQLADLIQQMVDLQVAYNTLMNQLRAARV